jgi:hypothetical protein
VRFISPAVDWAEGWHIRVDVIDGIEYNIFLRGFSTDTDEVIAVPQNGTSAPFGSWTADIAKQQYETVGHPPYPISSIGTASGTFTVTNYVYGADAFNENAAVGGLAFSLALQTSIGGLGYTIGADIGFTTWNYDESYSALEPSNPDFAGEDIAVQADVTQHAFQPQFRVTALNEDTGLMETHIYDSPEDAPGGVDPDFPSRPYRFAVGGGASPLVWTFLHDPSGLNARIIVQLDADLWPVPAT